MKICQLPLRKLAILGLGAYQSTNPTCLINRKNAKTLLILYLASGLCCAYLLIEANTFEDFAISVYITTSYLLGTVCYTIFMWTNRAIRGVLNFFEQVIDESEIVDFYMLPLESMHKYFTVFIIYFRTKMSNIDGKLRWNRFIGREMCENHRFCIHETNTLQPLGSEIDLLLLQVLCHGFGRGRFWVAISILVKHCFCHAI